MGTSHESTGDVDERPQHEVAVSAFRIQRHETTNVQYRRLKPNHDVEARGDLPTASVTWHAAYAYAAWLGGRLPTEAEWEYATRAGCPHPYCAQDGSATTADAVAWTMRNTRDAITGKRAPRPVMRLEPNPWGLYDMLGNLLEWTADWYDRYPASPQVDPWGPAASRSTRRVTRGGSHGNEIYSTRVAKRVGIAPRQNFDLLGFRVVLPPYSASTTRSP